MTFRCPSLVLMRLHAVLLHEIITLPVHRTSHPDFECNIPDGTTESGCFRYFMPCATDGTNCFLRNFLARLACSMFVVFVHRVCTSRTPQQPVLISYDRLSVLCRSEKTPPPPLKQKRKVLNLDKKADIIQAVTSRCKKCDMMSKECCSASISTIWRGRDAIICATSSGNLTKKKPEDHAAQKGGESSLYVVHEYASEGRSADRGTCRTEST